MTQQADIMRGYIAKFLIEAIDKDAIIDAFRKDFTFKGKLSVSDDGTVNLGACQKRDGRFFSQLPVKFGSVSGDFSCISAGLESLAGCPTSVRKDFVCTGNKLKNLIGCPASIGGNLICVGSGLRSLEGCPEIIHGEFTCSRNNLVSLQHGPRHVEGNFDCSDNPLTSLEYLPAIIGGYVKIPWSKDLPLLRLVRYRSVYLYNKLSLNGPQKLPEKILSKYTSPEATRRDIIVCQKELIDAGFEGNASW